MSGSCCAWTSTRWRDHLRRRRGRDPGPRAGGQGQRVRLRAGPAGPGGAPGSVSTRWPSGWPPRSPRSATTSTGDLVVLTPWRPDDEVAADAAGRSAGGDHGVPDGGPGRGRATRAERPPVLVEVLTSMRRLRHPAQRAAPRSATGSTGSTSAGWTIHLPLLGHRSATPRPSGSAGRRWPQRPGPLWFSHLLGRGDPRRGQRSSADRPTTRCRSGCGSAPCCGAAAPDTHWPMATVLDVHPVSPGSADRLPAAPVRRPTAGSS